MIILHMYAENNLSNKNIKKNMWKQTRSAA